MMFLELDAIEAFKFASAQGKWLATDYVRTLQFLDVRHGLGEVFAVE